MAADRPTASHAKLLYALLSGSARERTHAGATRLLLRAACGHRRR